VREKSLTDFLSLVEQDENNLRKLTVSCALRRDSQPELMMSLDGKAHNLSIKSQEDVTQDWPTKSAFYSPKPLKFDQTKKSPAWKAAREAFASPAIGSDSTTSSPPSSELSNEENDSLQLKHCAVRRNSFCLRNNPRIMNTNVFQRSRRLSLHVASKNPTCLFPPGRLQMLKNREKNENKECKKYA